jgi:perosamine synthetase
MTIPLFKPSVSEEEIEAVTRVMRSGWWAMGPEVEAFEEEFAAYTGTLYAVAVSSGTAALELAARATGITGSTVIVPALTFVSTALAMKHAGNKVVFADVCEEDLVIDWEDVQDKHQEHRARAVVPVWYGGDVVAPGVDYSHDFPQTLIEDCAHAAGSKLAGKVGAAACWSFHAVKNLATGDGGMVTTNDPMVAARLKPLRWVGIDKSTWERDQGRYGWDYDIPADGQKAHMNDITAAIGRVQLRRLDEMNFNRWVKAKNYNQSFSDLGWLTIPVVTSMNSNHLYVVRVASANRNKFIDHMLAHDVAAGVHYKPLTKYPHLFPGPHDVPVTERVWQEIVTLPLYPDLTEGEQAKVIETVRSFKA